MPAKNVLILIVVIVPVGVAITAQAQQDHRHDMPMQHQKPGSEPALLDMRRLVHYPENLRIHTLVSMRDHLLTLSEIQEALSREEFDEAGEIAKKGLGMSSLDLYGAHDVAQYMPKEMETIGTGMHQAASRFAIAASDAAVSGNVKLALAALSQVTQQCVARHSGFRLQ